MKPTSDVNSLWHLSAVEADKQRISLSSGVKVLTEGEGNDIEQSGLAMSIHQIKSHICYEKTCKDRL